MRVCSIAYTVYDYDPRVRRCAEALRRAGHRVVVLCLRSDHGPRVSRVDGVCLVGIQRGRVRGGSLLAYIYGYVSFFLRALWWTSRQHLRRRFQVVHANNMPNFVAFAALVPKLGGAGVLLDIHDSMPELFATKFGPLAGTVAGALLRVEERVSARYASAVTCVNIPHRDLTVTHGVPREKIEIVMNLPDDRIFSGPLPVPVADSPFTLVYHGLLSQRLGIDLVIEALAELDVNSRSWRYRIVGFGEARDELLRLSERLGLSDVIEFCGPVPPQDIPRLLKEASLAVLPLRPDPSTEVMLPTKLLEYLALGIPVAVTSTLCIETYFEGDTLWFLDDLSANGVAAAIDALRNDVGRRERMRQAGLEFSRTHRWSDEARRYVALIERLGARSMMPRPRRGRVDQ